MASAKTTIDHEAIRRWVEERGGYPAHVSRTGDEADPGVLRIDYPGFSGQGTLERISWDEFFDWFDRDNLAFLYQDESDSRFSKFVDRNTAGLIRSGGGSRKRTTAKRGGAKRGASSSKKRAGAKKASSKRAAPSTKRAGAKKASSSSRKRSAPSKKTSSRKASTAKKASAKKASSKKTSSKRRTSGRTVRSSSAITTTNHDEIRNWVESRGGFPAHVKRTGSRKDPGVLRIDYPGYSGTKTLERISWDDWFTWFDRDKLALLYQNKPNSRFSKLVRR